MGLLGERKRLAFDANLRSLISANVARFDRRVSDGDGKPAAVGLVIVDNEHAEPCFVLTRRPATMKRHANQFALPGGRIDGDETVVDAALREIHEEIGLALPPTAVLGMLDDFDTRSGFRITPVVVWGGYHAVLRPDPHEVASTHRVPLADLMADDLVHLDALAESEHPVLSLALLNNRIFAPTAALILQLREVALLGHDTRVGHFEQPRFAWR